MVMTGRERTALCEAGRAAFPGFELRDLVRTPSTQDVVRAAARGGAAAGFCCVAEEQTAGRGRQGRAWSAPAGSALLCSTLVRVRPGVITGVSLAAGLATRTALIASGPVDSRLKWPNDVMAAGRKLAGILCEVEPLAHGGGVAVVVGIGVNLATAAVATTTTATSVEELTGTAPPPAAVLAAVLTALSAWLAVLVQGGVGALRDDWMRHSWGMGAAVVARGPRGDVRGVAEGIDDDGALLIRDGATLTRVLAGDVHLVPGSAG